MRATDPWWTHPGLQVRDGRLLVAGRDAQGLSRDHGTPLYVYDLARIGEQAAALQGAFARRGVPFRLRLALKAQRDPAVLGYLRSLARPGSARGVGLDVCSPGELAHGLRHGWRPEEISYTGTNVSERDLDAILAHPVHVNVDLLSQLERFGRRGRGRRVGLRVNPRRGAASGVGRADLYSGGARPSKFGILEEQLPEALAVAGRLDLTIDTVHFHVGDGFLDEGLPRFAKAVDAVARMTGTLLEAGCPIAEVNAGGGLGVPQGPGQAPLDLDAYAGILVERLGPLGVGLAAEPGDFLTKEMGVLLAEVVSMELREGVTFVGLDAGYNVAPERFIYGSPLPVVPCLGPDAPPAGPVTITGNINEGDDVFAEDLPLPAVAEGDVLAMLGVGSYNASMHLDHCLRPAARVVAFPHRRGRRPELG
ncbi:MAG TPA: diaminopimelate decarboxylase [Actinomycetota bacterium]|jgi:diaminopimelate decarboxylase|nr:diaminopimelate decarboxylase [Actinomycetota bacterium]